MIDQAGRPLGLPGRAARAPEDVRRLPRRRLYSNPNEVRITDSDDRAACASQPTTRELARAELYGLLARLWLAPPDAALLQQFASR
jgi:hypothetical protein